MTDTSETNYFAPSKGSLTGFTRVDLPVGNPNIVETGWSTQVLKDFLLNESDINFPTEEFVRDVDDRITAHTQDFNNPHRVTLDQIMSSFSRDVLGSIVPGTPPNLPPFFAYDAVCALPFGDIFPATHSTQNMYRMTDGGSLIVPENEQEKVGTDLINNKAGLPLFQTITNYVPANWAGRSSTRVNTYIVEAAHQTISYPFNFYTLTETIANGSFGVSIPFTGNAVNMCTFTVFLFPLVTGGSVVISEVGNATKFMTVDLDEGTFTTSSNAVMGEIFVYPSGAIRASFSFTPLNASANSSVQVLHKEDGATTTERNGVINRPLFMFAYPVVTNAPVNQPVLINPALTAQTSDLDIQLEKLPAPPLMSNVMIRLSVNLYPVLATAPLPAETIFTFDKLVVKRNRDTIIVVVDGVSHFTTPILPGLNTLALSYSPTHLIFKDFALARQEREGAFPSLLTSNVSAGPFDGYLHSLTFYAMSDTTRCVEFLANG